MPNTKPIGVAYKDPQLDGAIIGESGGTTGFFGHAATTQPVSLTTQAIPALTTTDLPTLSVTQITALTNTLTNVNSVITDLKTLGLIAAS